MTQSSVQNEWRDGTEVVRPRGAGRGAAHHWRGPCRPWQQQHKEKKNILRTKNQPPEENSSSDKIPTQTERLQVSTGGRRVSNFTLVLQTGLQTTNRSQSRTRGLEILCQHHNSGDFAKLLVYCVVCLLKPLM